MKYLLSTLSAFVLVLCVASAGCAVSRSTSHADCCRPGKPCDQTGNCTNDCCKNAPQTAPGAATQPASLHSAVWQTDRQLDVTFGELPGSVRIVAMFYTTCEGTCVATLENLRRLDAALPARLRRHVHFVMVTLDPEHDSARALSSYRGAQTLPADRWSLLRGSMADTVMLANYLGLRFNPRSSRGFVHSNGIFILDSAGNLIQQQQGILPDINSAVASIQMTVDAAAQANAGG